MIANGCNMWVVLPQSGRQIAVRVDRKKMKNCRLKVYPDQSVVLSVPPTVPKDWLRDFLDRNADWIEGKLKRYAETAVIGNMQDGAGIQDGAAIRMFGGQRLLSVREGSHDCVYADGKTVRIESRTVQDPQKLQVQFDRWWRKEAFRYLTERVDALFPIVEKYGKDRPEVHVRRMRTLWGSCNAGRGKVTFNLHLIREAPECIDYVVLHELTHLIHPDHSKRFYEFIETYMPDWKERKRKLDRGQTAQGQQASQETRHGAEETYEDSDT